jgi:3-hydroxyisobutyrate dehydrogenase
MVGCENDDFAAEEALQPIAKAVIHAGAGAGLAAKVYNNMLLGISMLGTCEALALAEKLSLEAEGFFEIASRSPGQSWSFTTHCPVPGIGPETPADCGYTGGFATAMVLKEIKLANLRRGRHQALVVPFLGQLKAHRD